MGHDDDDAAARPHPLDGLGHFIALLPSIMVVK
jgi:hypothetical protein